MRITGIAVMGLTIGVLGGCTTPEGAVNRREDPEIAARCTPVTELLSKNYHREGSLDLGVVGGGGMVDKTGAILSGEQAVLVTRMDQACRAWVRGALNDDQYSDLILNTFSAAIVRTTTPADRSQVAASNARQMRELQDSDSLPKSMDPSALAGRVASDAQLSWDELQRRLDSAFAGIPALFDQKAESDLHFQVAVLGRLNALETELRTRLPGDRSDNRPSAETMPAALDIYFSTGSAELTFDSRAKLHAAARAWLQRGSHVRITGYADPRGSVVDNISLSRRRAVIVADELRGLGIVVTNAQGAGVGPASADNEFDAMRVTHIQID